MVNKKIKILVCVDVQNDFIDGTLGSEQAKAVIPNIISKVKKFKGDYIVFTRDTHDKDYLQTKEGTVLPVEHCITLTNGWFIEENVFITAQKNKANIAVFNKPTFGSEEFGNWLKKIEGEIEIEFCGFCTSICVLSNAILAKMILYNRGDVIVDSKCCACVTEESHNAALESMKMCQITVK